MSTTYNRTQVIARCKAWTGGTVQQEMIGIDHDGSIKVYDHVACHWTSCHALSKRTQARLLKRYGSICPPVLYPPADLWQN